MEIMEAIKSRYMYRGLFQDRKVEDEIVLQLLEAARWAPSGHNSQPWEFIVIDGRDTIMEIAEISLDSFNRVQEKRKDLKDWVQNWLQWLRWSEKELEETGDGVYMSRMSKTAWEDMRGTESPDQLRARLLEIFPAFSRPSKILSESPCLIYTLLDRAKKIPDSSRGLMALTSTGAAIQNIRLAAHALGLAAHELSPLYDLPDTRKRIKKLLNIPDHFRIVSAMRVGYPANPVTSLRSHVRRPIEELVHRNRF